MNNEYDGVDEGFLEEGYLDVSSEVTGP